jgi:membrane-bound lytic murein transglycosylase D
MQKQIYFHKKTYLKGFITGLLFFCICLISFGQPADNVFTKRLNSLKLNIELPYNDIIGDNIHFLTHQGIQFTAKSLGAFFEERKYIDSALTAARLPKELQYLPLSLTQTNTSAGFWQLPYIVAIKYGLVISDEIDERLDIQKSTSAAVSYLQKLSKKYKGNLWDIIIAYSNSAATLESAKIRTNQSKDIWILYEQGNLPNKNIIPNFITSIYLVNFYQSHHIKPVAPEKNEDNAIIVFPKPSPPIVQMKPAPSDNLPKTTSQIKKDDKKKINYTVKSGDNLTKIAKKYNVSVANIQKWNNLKNDRINAGQKLIIYQ